MEHKEKRKAKRISTNLQLRMEPLEDGGETIIADVTNISKSGIGFETERALSDHSFYRARLELETKESMDAIIETVRHSKSSMDKIQYGGRFIAMSNNDQFKIEVFRLFVEENMQKK